MPIAPWRTATVLPLCLLLLPSCSRPTSADSKAQTQGHQTATRVGVIQAQRKELVRKINLPGTLVAASEATLYGKVAGYLRSISVDKGDRVRAGQTLAVIEVPEMTKEVEQADAVYNEAIANLEKAKTQMELQAATYQRYRDVQSKEPGAVSQQEVDESRAKYQAAKSEVQLAEAKVGTARASRERLVALERYSRILAPFSGVITARFVDPGALIQAATSSAQAQPVVTIQNLDTLRTYVNVPELEVPKIHKGNEATLTMSAYPGRVFTGSVTRFAEALDPATRTMKTEIDIPNPQHVLRPGMYVDVTLELEKHPKALVIPDSALVIEGERKFAWVVRNGTAHHVPLETELDDGWNVEIVRGLDSGESVIVAGKDGLSEGKPVQPSPLSSWAK